MTGITSPGLRAAVSVKSRPSSRCRPSMVKNPGETARHETSLVSAWSSAVLTARRLTPRNGGGLPNATARTTCKGKGVGLTLVRPKY